MAGDKLSFRTISRKGFAGLFSYCAHTPLKSADVPFGGYDLSILRPLLTLIDGG